MMMSDDAGGGDGLGAEALSRMAQDEAMARYLQAMDNGLRSRKRSTSSTSSPYSIPHEDITPSRRRSKSKLSAPSSSSSPAGPSPSKKASPGRNASSSTSGGSKRDAAPHDHERASSSRSRGMSPESGSMSPHSSKSGADSPAPAMRYCQGCGQTLARRGSHALDAYNCEECISLYSLPHPLSTQALSPKSPSSSSSSSHWPASPAHKCPGCPLSFLFQDRLREHQDRVHA